MKRPAPGPGSPLTGAAIGVLTLGLAAPAPAAARAAAPACAQQQVAVLDDGTRVAARAGTAPGTYDLATPFGRWRDPGARVVALEDAAREAGLLAPLRALDYRTWVQRCAERGLLRTLVAEEPPPEHRGVLLDALRPWGQRLDPLPEAVPSDDRVDLLWRLALESAGARRALFVGALEVEISAAHLASKRRVALGDWSRALDARAPAVRWAAARVAAQQRDVEMLLPLLEVGLEDRDAWVASHAARALLATDPSGALYRWAYEMVTDRDSARARRAALWLGRHGREEAATALGVADRLRHPRGVGIGAGGLGGRCSNGSFSAGGAAFATERSVLEVRPASRAVTLVVAEVLERAAEAPRGEEVEDPALLHGTPAERGRAWRRHLLAR